MSIYALKMKISIQSYAHPYGEPWRRQPQHCTYVDIKAKLS